MSYANIIVILILEFTISVCIVAKNMVLYVLRLCTQPHFVEVPYENLLRQAVEAAN